MNRSAARRLHGSAALLVAATLVACGGVSTSPSLPMPGTPEPSDARPGPTVVLISIDGCRWDCLDRGVTPSLDRLAREGVRADALVPSFPTKTFPNHYTLVTGLYPDRHGIVANSMYDPVFEARFSMYDRSTVQDARWYGGEPIWVTAEKNGRTSAPFFWPGSEAPIGGIRPSYWMPYDAEMPTLSRVDTVLALLDLPVPVRPAFLTIYYAAVDEVGHENGPDSPELERPLREVDTAIGVLLDGLRERELLDLVNVVVVSDHGMTPTSRERLIFLDDYLDPEALRISDWNPVAALWPPAPSIEEVYGALAAAHASLDVYRRPEIPRDLHFGSHRRVAPIIAIAAPGWSIGTRARFAASPARYDGGNHGYNPAATDMHGIFVARGPAFRRGQRVPAFANTHVYSLLMEILGLPARPSDGSLEAVRHLLAP